MYKYVVRTLLRKHVLSGTGRGVTYKSFEPVLADIGLLMRMLIQAGQMPAEHSKRVYQAQMRSFGLGIPVKLPQYNVENLEQSLRRLSELSPRLKKHLITTCADCVLADNIVHPAEVELLRAVAEVLDCPMPPLV